VVLVELFFILGVTIPTKAAKKCVVPVGKASAWFRFASKKFDAKKIEVLANKTNAP